MPIRTYAKQTLSGGNPSAIRPTNQAAARAIEDTELNAARGILFALFLSVPLWLAGLLAAWSL